MRICNDTQTREQTGLFQAYTLKTANAREFMTIPKTLVDVAKPIFDSIC